MYAASSAASVTDPSCPMPFASSSADSELTSMLNDCPPSKPISIRTRLSARRDHLDENAVHRIRMDERDLEPEQALVRLGVDQLGARLLQPRDRRADVGNLIRNVVHSRSAAGEKATDRRVGLERLEELHAALTDAHGRRLHALVRNGRAMLGPRAEEGKAAYLAKHYEHLTPEGLARIDEAVGPAGDDAARRAAKAYADIGFDELVFVPMIPTIDQVQRLLDLNL